MMHFSKRCIFETVYFRNGIFSKIRRPNLNHIKIEDFRTNKTRCKRHTAPATTYDAQFTST